jgi:hypothetical protein
MRINLLYLVLQAIFSINHTALKISLVSLPGAKYFDIILLSTMLKYGLIAWLPDTLIPTYLN